MDKLILIGVISLVIFTSCNRCDCNEEYNDQITYKKGNKVLYQGVCYKAIHQGNGIEPGPWLENGNDIWEICEK